MKKYRFTLAFAALLIIWLAVGPQILNFIAPQQSAFKSLPASTEVQGKLYYTQGLDGIWQIDLVSRQVSRWWQPPDGGLVGGIAVSPDESQLAIGYAPPAPEGYQNGTTDLYFSPVEHPNLQPALVRETNKESFRNPDWSPDGNWVYYSHLKPMLDDNGDSLGFDLNVERLRPGDISSVETILEGAEQPSLSPDGTQITFLNFDTRSYAQGVSVTSLNSLDSRVLIPAGAFQMLSSPKFAPDGRAVFFSASGGLQRQIGQNLNGVVRAHGAPWDIWHMLEEGTDLTKMTPTTLDGPWFSWSPDGQHLAVIAAEGVFVTVDGEFYRLTSVTSEGEIVWLK